VIEFVLGAVLMMAALLAAGAVLWFVARPRITFGVGRASNSPEGPSDIDIQNDRLTRLETKIEEALVTLRRVERMLRETAVQVTSPHVSAPTARVSPGFFDDAVAPVESNALPPPTRGSTSSSGLIGEFLRRADAGPLTYDEARELALINGTDLEVVRSVGSEWRVVAVRDGREWLAVPVPRMPMGNAELASWFDLSRYSGIDPLKPNQIVKPAILTKERDQWSLVQKGQIDGGS